MKGWGFDKKPRHCEPLLDGPELATLTHHPTLFTTNFTATFGMLSFVTRTVQSLSPRLSTDMGRGHYRLGSHDARVFRRPLGGDDSLVLSRSSGV